MQSLFSKGHTGFKLARRPDAPLSYGRFLAWPSTRSPGMRAWFGTVTDATGAAVPGATVTLTNTDTNAVSKIVSSGNGDFTLNALPIGNYRAKVEMARIRQPGARW